MKVKHFLSKNGEIREVIEHFEGGVLVALGFIEGFVNPEFDDNGRIVGWQMAKGVKKSSEKDFNVFKTKVESSGLVLDDFLSESQKIWDEKHASLLKDGLSETSIELLIGARP